jgi:peptide-methionine (R)-S-oxide reductase
MNNPTKAKSTWAAVVQQADRGNPVPPRRDERSTEQWQAALTQEQFYVMRHKGTERPHSSEMCSLFTPGIYACAGCNTPLFDSSHKFESGTGWPSFSGPIEATVVAYHNDGGFGMTRIETTCNVCDAHLGHVFPDGPAPSGLRYCINAVSLKKISANTAG